MKSLILITAALMLTACSDAKFSSVDNGCDIVEVEGGAEVTCDNETVFLPDGQNGDDGSDGDDAANLTKVTVPANSCTKVAPGLWVENIQNGKFMDVYANDQCKDNLGEYCDNVEVSYGSTGQFGENKRGGAEVCWAGDIQVSGSKLDNGDIKVFVLIFN